MYYTSIFNKDLKNIHLDWILLITRFSCNNSTLNHDLFITNCVVSPACPHCNAPEEDVKHYLLYCSMYAAHRIIALFISATHLRTQWEINGFWLRTRKRLNGFCLVLQICNFTQMFVFSNKFSHLFISRSFRFS